MLFFLYLFVNCCALERIVCVCVCVCVSERLININSLFLSLSRTVRSCPFTRPISFSRDDSYFFFSLYLAFCFPRGRLGLLWIVCEFIILEFLESSWLWIRKSLLNTRAIDSQNFSYFSGSSSCKIYISWSSKPSRDFEKTLVYLCGFRFKETRFKEISRHRNFPEHSGKLSVRGSRSSSPLVAVNKVT